jgi:hypothetical protein
LDEGVEGTKLPIWAVRAIAESPLICNLELDEIEQTLWDEAGIDPFSPSKEEDTSKQTAWQS